MELLLTKISCKPKLTCASQGLVFLMTFSSDAVHRPTDQTSIFEIAILRTSFTINFLVAPIVVKSFPVHLVIIYLNKFV